MKLEKFLLQKYETTPENGIGINFCDFLTTRFLLGAGKKILQYIYEKAEIFTRKFSLFIVMLVFRKFYSMPLSDERKGLLSATFLPKR